MVQQDMMTIHMNMNPGMTQSHHMMAPGMPHIGIPPNPMHHEHMPQSSMYNNSESAYHHHMQSLGCPPQSQPTHVPQQLPPQQLQQLSVQQPIMPGTSESPVVSNSVPYSDPVMTNVHMEQPLQVPPEQQPQEEVAPLLQQEQLPQHLNPPPPLMPQSPVELEPQPQVESPIMEQMSQSPLAQTEVQSPELETNVKQDSILDCKSPIPSPTVDPSETLDNDNTSIGSRQSRSLSPAELNEPQSLERDCWSGSEHDPPPPTLTAEVSPPVSSKDENETIETSVFNFTEDEEPPPPLHSLPERTPRKLKGLIRYLNLFGCIIYICFI